MQQKLKQKVVLPKVRELKHATKTSVEINAAKLEQPVSKKCQQSNLDLEAGCRQTKVPVPQKSLKVAERCKKGHLKPQTTVTSNTDLLTANKWWTSGRTLAFIYVTMGR